MNERYGQQYSGDDSFKSTARLHQSKYRKDILNADFKDYGNRLAEQDALSGKNFYLELPGLFDEVKKRFPLKYSRLYYDMLRSEHIPFNFFIPLKLQIGTSGFSTSLLSRLINEPVSRITRIEVEYAPKPAEHYLNDQTSFDAFIEYIRSDQTKGFLGIEVKYTEKEYPYGVKEKLEMENPHSIYNTLTLESGLYNQESIKHLKDPRYKQVWRNHLLAEKMLRTKHLGFTHYTSLILFPEGNSHFADVCKEYGEFLKGSQKSIFKGITFEQFISAAREISSDKRCLEWLNYLQTRYIF